MLWNETIISRMLEIRYPIIQAPMAASTPPELVAAVSNAGGLGSLAVALMTPEQIKQNIRSVRKLTNKPFAVNLFVYEPEPIDIKMFNAATNAMLAHFPELESLMSQEIPKLISYEEQLEIILQEKVSIFSFTFGVLPSEWMEKLKTKNITIIGTATTVREAQVLEQSGVDAVVCQGAEAGGHRGSFLTDVMSSLVSTMVLTPQVVDAISIPVIASGGIMDGRGIAAALCLGASAAQMGTAFLTTDEAQIHPLYKEALMNPKEGTTLTRAFTGRYARSIRNRFINEMENNHTMIASYPYQRMITAVARKALKDEQLKDFMPLWAGEGSAACQAVPAQQLMKGLIEQVTTIFKRQR